MKKGLIVMLGLMAVACLAACEKNQPVDNNPVDLGEGVVYVNENPENNEVENNTVENNVVENNETDNNVIEDNGIVYKTSLTLDEIKEIDAKSFPRWYSYEKYGWEAWEPEDAWEYVYGPWDGLLPVYERRVNEQIISSSLEDGMLYTMVALTLDDESVVSVLYINDPVSLEYVAASVNDDNGATLYTFNY